MKSVIVYASAYVCMLKKEKQIFFDKIYSTQVASTEDKLDRETFFYRSMNWLIALFCTFFTGFLYFFYCIGDTFVSSLFYRLHSIIFAIFFFFSFASMLFSIYTDFISERIASLSEGKRSIKGTLIGFLCHVSSSYH